MEIYHKISPGNQILKKSQVQQWNINNHDVRFLEDKFLS